MLFFPQDQHAAEPECFRFSSVRGANPRALSAPRDAPNRSQLDSRGRSHRKRHDLCQDQTPTGAQGTGCRETRYTRIMLMSAPLPKPVLSLK